MALKKPTADKIAEGTYRSDRDGGRYVPRRMGGDDDVEKAISYLPDPPVHLLSKFDDTALGWYKWLGVAAIKYKTLHLIDIPILAQCCLMFAEAARLSKISDVHIQKMMQLEMDYEEYKANMRFGYQMPFLKLIMEEKIDQRNTIKMWEGFVSSKLKEANRLAAKFGATPVDRIALRLSNENPPQNDEDDDDVMG